MEISIEDSIIYKYGIEGPFNKNRAVITSTVTNLYGYIDKTGKEVIPCKYLNAKDFHGKKGCELAAVQDPKTKLWIYINQRGERLAGEHLFVADFCEVNDLQKESYSCVSDKVGLYYYIDSKGNRLSQHNFSYASDFSDGFAVVREDDQNKKSFFDGKIITLPENLEICFGFSEGIAILENENYYYLITPEFLTSGMKISEFHENAIAKELAKKIYPCSCGKVRITNKDGKDNYFDVKTKELMTGGDFYLCGEDYSENNATIEFDENFGIMDQKGLITMPANQKYSTIGKKMSDGRIRVSDGKRYGFIDQHFNEVINCRFKRASDFSDGLSLATSEEGHLVIDTLGRPVFSVPKIYASAIRVPGGDFSVYGETPEQLREEKLKVLKSLKENSIASIKREFEEVEKII